MITILPISHNEAIKFIQRGIRSISYSLITKGENEQELIDYILRKDIVGIHFSYGTQAHAVIGNADFQHPADVKSYIDDNNQVFLSYHQISETMLMKIAIEQHRQYKLKHLDNLVYEKKLYCILKYKKYSFLLKAYIDAYNQELNTILEFKTTSTMFNMMASINKYNYDMQAAIYYAIIHAHCKKEPNVEFFFLNKIDNHEIGYIPVSKRLLSSGNIKLINMMPKVIDILIKHKYINIFNLKI